MSGLEVGLGGWGEGFVGGGDEVAYLPHLGFGEDFGVGGHAAEADAVFDLPEGLADRIVGDADDGAIAVFDPKLRGDGVHVICERRRVVWNAMAEGALLPVDAGTFGKVGIREGDGGGRGHLAVDAGR